MKKLIFRFSSSHMSYFQLAARISNWIGSLKKNVFCYTTCQTIDNSWIQKLERMLPAKELASGAYGPVSKT